MNRGSMGSIVAEGLKPSTPYKKGVHDVYYVILHSTILYYIADHVYFMTYTPTVNPKLLKPYTFETCAERSEHLKNPSIAKLWG